MVQRAQARVLLLKLPGDLAPGREALDLAAQLAILLVNAAETPEVSYNFV